VEGKNSQMLHSWRVWWKGYGFREGK